MINILIPEDIPSHNKGEAALFFGLKESLRPFGEIKFTLFSLHPEIDRKNYAGEATVVDAKNVTPAHMLDGQGSKVLKLVNYLNFMIKHLSFGLLYKLLDHRAVKCMSNPIWQAYVDADLILMSHDSFYTPLYHGTQAILFKIMGKPTIIYAATVKRNSKEKTSLKARLLDCWVAYTCKKLSRITLREDMSRDYLMEIGVTDQAVPISVHPDLAFIVPPIATEKALSLLRTEGVPEDRPLVGMAISQRKLDFAFPGQNIQKRREKALLPIIKMTDFITDTLDATVVFIPHSIGPSSVLDDRITADMIRDQAENPEKIIIIRNEYSTQQLKGMAACLDMTIGTRLHFAIDALCSAVPSLLITHDGDFRCHGIVGNMLGLNDYVYNIDNIDTAALIETTADLWQNRVAVGKYISNLMTTITKDTYLHGEAAIALLEERLPNCPPS